MLLNATTSTRHRKWTSEHGMTLSVRKCYAMHTSPCVGAACFGDLKLGISSLPIVSTLRIFGVTFSHDLP